MGSNFYETIVLKEDSYQDYEYELKKHSFSSTQQEIDMLEKGIQGEKQLLYHLNKSNIGMYVLRDVNFKYNDMTAQIDFVVVTAFKCYFIECKNYSADIIHVDENRNFEMSTRYGKRYNRKAIDSPISQVEDQFTVFQKICLDDVDKVKELLQGNKFKDYFKTLVVFTNSNNRLNLTKAPNDIKYRILKVDNLIRQIEYDKNHYKGKLLSQEEMLKIVNLIMKYNSTDKIEEVKNKIIELKRIEEKRSQQNNNNLLIKLLDDKNGRKILAAVTTIIIMGLFLLFSLFSKIVYNNVKEKENTSITQTVKKLTDNELKAIETIKANYAYSKENGFSLMHTSNCRAISKVFNGKLSCGAYPLMINLIDDNNITILHSFNCYSLKYNSNNEIEEASVKYVGNDINNECPGLAVGIAEWDNDNEYFQKIGGYNKLLEISKESYKTGIINSFYTDTYITERGGNKGLYVSYYLDVDAFFKGVTGRGALGASDTTKNEFEEMVKNYYYIMK